MKPNRLITFFILIGAIVFAANPALAKRSISDNEREEGLKNMREFSHKYFRKHLQLSRDQETKFFQIYDQMSDELLRVGAETRALERKITNDPQATDIEMESAARSLFEQKKREADIELKYFDELKEVLTKRQLLKFKEVERDMKAELLKHASRYQRP